MKYCGVVRTTPFRGVRVYARSAMGMPGSEPALEELLCRVLGDLLEEGVVVKLADDIYCGGNTIAELQQSVRRLGPTAKLCKQRFTTIRCQNNDVSDYDHDTRLGMEPRHHPCEPTSNRHPSQL